MNNYVELVGHYGSDMTHALSAWTSTSRELTEEKRARVDKLLLTLASENHGTPFEKSSLHFLVRTDIATHIHILKHRHLSVNAESARYRELKDDEYYIPVDWDEEDIIDYRETVENCLAAYHRILRRRYHKYIALGMTEKQARSRAKESARFCLPYGKQITSDVMFNFRSFNHFIRLRYSVHAQLEVREVAKQMLEQVRDCGSFPFSLDVFGLVDKQGNVCEPFQ